MFPQQRFSRYFIWLGLALVVAGAVILGATGEGFAYGLILVGLLLLGWGVSHFPGLGTGLQRFWRKRSTQMGTNGVVGAIAILLIFCLTNFLAVQLPLRIDLTENQIHTLSSQTQGVLQNLSQPLTLWLFQETDDANLKPFLDNYQRLNPNNFRYVFVDPDRNIEAVQRFQVESRGEVHLEYGDKTQLLKVLAQGEPLTESQLTNSILQIQGDRQPHLYVLQGHGEPPLDQIPGGLGQMAQLLATQGYAVSPLNFTQTPTIPPDADLIAVIGPQTPFLPGEVALLETALANNQSLLLLLDPQTDPQLNSLLDKWGLSLDQRLILDQGNRADFLGLGQSTLVLNQYGDHPITTALAGQNSIYQAVRPIFSDTTEAIAATAILSTDDQAWAESQPEIPDPTFNPPGDRPGPLTFGWALEKIDSQATMKATRLVAIGNTTFVTNGWLEQYLNSDLLLNTVNWLAQTEEAPLAIQPRTPQERRLNLRRWQIATLAWFAPILFPLGGLGGAIFCLWRRR
ncbi:ABC transporter [Picosynechococcus sp. PCC 11901]|uniref:GldG family protein n=1 Tax=Picosynechococcus sp. PCC 11901 TaxID=2579791 RepID=UPI0010FC0077|nr:Gldg family protein [Picosynechococcus sp. PCC 11901]QCS50702.1 ABC transporter [Picosynechococcus sp. PCC 11901]